MTAYTLWIDIILLISHYIKKLLIQIISYILKVITQKIYIQKNFHKSYFKR